MLGLICRKTKDDRVFCVHNNRIKQKLLPIIVNNVTTIHNEEDNLAESQSIKTLIFSNSFSSYQINDFKELDFILKKVNHSVWFGYGTFHINTVKSM